MILDEFKKFSNDSPKIMEQIINSSSLKQEENLSKMLTEQDLVNTIIGNHQSYTSKDINFRELRAKTLYILNNADKFQTPGSVIHEVPEHLENIGSSDNLKKDFEKKNSSSSLKQTNLDIVMQRNKLPSQNNFAEINEEKILSSKKLHSEKNFERNENQIEKMKESSSSFKEKMNESNYFMKEAEEHFEKDISMSEFKKVDLEPDEEKNIIQTKQPFKKKVYKNNDEDFEEIHEKHANKGEIHKEKNQDYENFESNSHLHKLEAEKKLLVEENNKKTREIESKNC